MKTTVILISAKGCRACSELSKIWPDIKKNLSKVVDFDPIPLQSLSESLPDNTPREILDMSSLWFPMIIIANTEDWNNAKVNRNINMRFAIMNTIVEDGNIVKKVTMHNTVENITNWVRSKISVVTNGPPLLQKNKQITQSQTQFNKPVEEKVERSNGVSKNVPLKPFTVHDSMFIPTCNRNVNIVPTVQNGGYSPF